MAVEWYFHTTVDPSVQVGPGRVANLEHLWADATAACCLWRMHHMGSMAMYSCLSPTQTHAYTRTHTRMQQDNGGHHSSALFVQWVPYELKGTTWEAEEDRYVQKLLSIADRFAPGALPVPVLRRSQIADLRSRAWDCAMAHPLASAGCLGPRVTLGAAVPRH